MVDLRRARSGRHPGRAGIGAVLLIAVALPATAALETLVDSLRPTPVVARTTGASGRPGRAPAERFQRIGEALPLPLVLP